ncbi:MAG TPA: hypothetical protein VGQ76_27300 [Thermoanaerobaculia bacterium]|jgi:hypothetical protein|nr:hypothetical protein [Thermoanaerobaculia bacterium]
MKKLWLCLVLLLLALPAAAQFRWNIVGSAAQLDQSALISYRYSGARLEFQPATTGQMVARYPVRNTSNLFPEPNWDIFRMTYQDSDGFGSITARLIVVEECSGEEELLCQIESSDTGAGTSCSICIFPDDINFQTHAYFIEAELDRSEPFSEVALIMMSLSH